MTIDEVMTVLEQPWAFADVFNPWSDIDPLDTPKDQWPAVHRKQRLRKHFDCKPELLLIGEAPGYQGCHFSGIPFTSERLICEGKIPRLMNVPQNWRATTRKKPWSEPSATIVWGALHDLGIAHSTVLWNAFAWHPHLPGKPMSNRKPTETEMNIGQGALYSVLKLFHGVPVVSVGKVAQAALKKLDVEVAAHVRHPANGGARAFREGLRALR